MDIQIKPADPRNRKPKPSTANELHLTFGDIFTDHMFAMDYIEGRGWINPRIQPYAPIALDPAAMALHYGQEIFEGLKAYHGKHEGIYIFRPRDNFERFNRSAARICMPGLDVDLALRAMKELVLLERDWIPKSPGTALYIRPTMLATEPHLGVRPAREYLFFIILGPAGAYYKEGFSPVKIHVEDFYVRAAIGGTGEAKTAGNYAASLYATELCKARGFTQVLWLDAAEHRYVEEVGTMNMFFVLDDEVTTPALNGSILSGITRDSVLALARHWGLRVTERRIAIDEILDAAASGRLREAFGTGTAAVISPVGQLSYKDKDYTVGDGKLGPLSGRLYAELIGLQYGHTDDPFGWVERLA